MHSNVLSVRLTGLPFSTTCDTNSLGLCSWIGLFPLTSAVGNGCRLIVNNSSMLSLVSSLGAPTWAPDIPKWAYPINHERWFHFTKDQQHEIGRILYETPYCHPMLLPGNATEAAGVTRHTYDIDTDNEPDTE
jgi:hypothetical protein